MGITGLIPFLEKSSTSVHVSQFSGCTVAIDSYCWLHKGAFSCADKLARGDSCNVYVHYCMKYINMLLEHNIKPIMVFDGRHLPAKADTEKKRRETREVNRRRAAELMRLDKPDQARTYLQRCIDVTHEMALALMQECRARNVDCITAPYEADAQLAYLNINNIADIVVTEDSDLLLFGCTKVLFKMDINGGGKLIEQDKLYLSMGVHPANFSMEKFIYMCILSGCDYLPSLPGIGLNKACKFVKRTADPDIHRALSRLGSHLNMNLVVPLEYRDRFLAAIAMFQHQPVFDPITRKIVPLTPLPPGAQPPPLPEKDILSPKKALQLAYGNLDPFTMEIVDDWDPEKPQPKAGKTSNWKVTARASHKSIWSLDFKPKAFVFGSTAIPPVKHTSTVGKEKQHQLDIISTSKRPPPPQPPSNDEMLDSLRKQFGSAAPSSKKVCLDISSETSLMDEASDVPAVDKLLDSSANTKHHNPFSIKLSPTKKTISTTSSKFSALSKFSRFRKTEVDDNFIVQSRYFGSNIEEVERVNKISNNSDLPDSNTLLKDIQNITSCLTPEEKPSTTLQREKFINNSPIKQNLEFFNSEVDKSPIKRKSLFTVLDKNNEVIKNEEINAIIFDNEKKENSSDGKPIITSEKNTTSTFKWARSLEDRFGFKNSQIKSSKCVSNEFRNPLKDCLIQNKTESTINLETEQQKKNPFKVCNFKFKNSLGSQGSSCEEDIGDDSLLTNSISDSSFSSLSSQEYKSVLMTPPTSVQCRRLGLSKKTTPNGGRQQSLLNMFGFKQKNKLQK